MKPDDVVGYAAVFLGGGFFGGVVKTLLDHWLVDRRARRSGLRPIDRQRIEVVRRGTKELVETSIGQAFEATTSGHAPTYPTKMQPETADATWTALEELADRRLQRRWRNLEEHARSVPGRCRGLQASADVQRIWNELYAAQRRVVARLNEIERDR